MNKQLFTGAAIIALAIPGVAFAQSTGTQDAETIVVTGSRAQGIAGVELPDTPKAQTVLGNTYLQTQAAGQSIVNAINVVPSVNFTDNDPYGSSGGNVRIRGFDGNRISLTFDGMPLNDTGNYAIFSNQQLDAEIIDSVNVNQGTTDVDSPTAASSGGTINYRSIVPTNEYGAILKASYGDFDFHRVIAVVNSGEFTASGTKMFASASYAHNNKFKGPGDLTKQQYNIRFYQPLSGRDFIAISGNFNRNRNNQYRTNLTLAQAALDYSDNQHFDFDQNPRCVRPTFVNGRIDNENGTLQPIQTIPGTNENSCTNYYGVRVNPSDTGNVHANMRFSLTDKLVLTVDPSFQYVLANGGGFTTLAENNQLAKGANQAGPGVDFSRDGDFLDTVAFYSPNTTNTYRYGVLSSLRYDFSEGQYFRLAYALDYGRHRQTGEWTYLDAIGNPLNVFGGRTGNGPKVLNADGYALRQRDRFSIAELNQVSAEYRGKFFDDAVEVMVGVRAPFFHRELNQYCLTAVSSGFATCTTQVPLATRPATGTAPYIVAPGTVFTGAVPTNAFYAPFKATYNYRKVLPNLGLTFHPADAVTIFGSYAKGLSAPRTDNLYNAPRVNVSPETTNNFDVGVRYKSSTIQASFGGFLNKFKNRIVTSFDSEQGISIDRNVGRVEIKGLEATLDVRPVSWFTFRGFGSYIDAKLKDDIRLGTTVAGSNGATASGLPIIALTAGKKLVETPTWQYGYRASVNFDPVSVGLNFKHVTSRFATDLNNVKLPGYSTFNADARLSLKRWGLEKTFIQVNAINLFNTQYLGSISSQITTSAIAAGSVTNVTSAAAGANPTFAVASPRAISATLQVGF